MTDNASPEVSGFDVSNIEHKRVEKYHPQFIGVGGQHVVYALPDYPDKVVKVDANMLLRGLEWKANTQDEVPTNYVKLALDQDTKRIKNLRAYFGNEHTLEQSVHYLKVPVNERVISEMYQRFRRRKDPTEVIKNFSGNEVKSIVSIQEKSPELNDPNRLSAASGYAEREAPNNDPNFEEAYNKLTSQTVTGNSTEPFNIQDLAKVHPGMEKVITSAINDPDLQASLKNFAQRAINYSKVTGESLDLAGSDNVIFFKKEATWNYKLVDALYPSPPPSEGKIQQTRNIISEAAQNNGESIDKGDANVLMNTLNYVHVVNGLATWLGADGRIDLVPEGVSVTPDMLMKTINNAYPSQ